MKFDWLQEEMRERIERLSGRDYSELVVRYVGG